MSRKRRLWINLKKKYSVEFMISGDDFRPKILHDAAHFLLRFLKRFFARRFCGKTCRAFPFLFDRLLRKARMNHPHRMSRAAESGA